MLIRKGPLKMSYCQYKTLLNCIINARFSQLTHLTPFLKYSLDFIRARENEKNTSGEPKPVDSFCSARFPQRGIINILSRSQARLLVLLSIWYLPPRLLASELEDSYNCKVSRGKCLRLAVQLAGSSSDSRFMPER